MSVLTLSHVHYKNDFNTCRTVQRLRRPLLYRPMTVSSFEKVSNIRKNYYDPTKDVESKVGK